MVNNIRKFCIAPMMGYTTPHARKLYRILSKKAFLFTEMIPAKTLIYSNKKNELIENDDHNPIALQIGGSDYKDLVQCCKIAENYNYNEINLNVGCPSKAVQKGSFGACMMQDKVLVRNCLEKMLHNTSKEISIKCRIGIGNNPSYEFFHDFIDEVIKSGVKIIYVHARTAILNGLSPKNNRSAPPLNYSYVSKIKKEYPKINFILNGGINNLNDALELSNKYDGVMLGRLIQNNPFCLSKIDELFFDYSEKKAIYRNVITEYFEYINLRNDSIYRLLSPLLQIFFGVHNGKKIKSEIHMNMKNKKIDKLQKIFLEFIEKKEVAL